MPVTEHKPRTRRVYLTRKEIFAVADWHTREADHHEQSIDEYGDGYDEQKREWAAAARKHRRRARSLYDYALDVRDDAQ